MTRIIFAIMLTMVFPQTVSAQGIFDKIKRKWSFTSKENDLIIKRDGTETEANVKLVMQDYTYYVLPMAPEKGELVCDNANIYLIKFAERGNMFFSEIGGFFFDEANSDISEDATIIYLTKGEEIVAYDVMRDGANFRCYTSKKKTEERTVPVNEVFIVKSVGCPNEVITPLQERESFEVSQEISLPKDEFVEIVERKPATEYIIKTQRNTTIRALVIYGNDRFVSYIRKDNPHGPIFRMERKDIKRLTAVQSRKRR